MCRCCLSIFSDRVTVVSTRCEILKPQKNDKKQNNILTYLPRYLLSLRTTYYSNISRLPRGKSETLNDTDIYGSYLCR